MLLLASTGRRVGGKRSVSIGSPRGLSITHGTRSADRRSLTHTVLSCARKRLLTGGYTVGTFAFRIAATASGKRSCKFLIRAVIALSCTDLGIGSTLKGYSRLKTVSPV